MPKIVSPLGTERETDPISNIIGIRMTPTSMWTVCHSQIFSCIRCRGAVSGNVSRPMSGLQVVLQSKMQIYCSLLTQSRHKWNLSNRRHPGNLMPRRYMKTVFMGSSYTPKTGYFGDVGFGVVVFTTDTMHRWPRRPLDVYPYNFGRKVSIILKLGRLVKMSATNGGKKSEEYFKFVSALYQLPEVPAWKPPKIGMNCFKIQNQIWLVPK